MIMFYIVFPCVVHILVSRYIVILLLLITLSFAVILQNFKYKMKLTPGNFKKGKIAKQAQEVFVMFKDCTSTERKCIESLNRSELTASVIGEAKISMPGLQAVQRKQKTAVKSEKKKSGIVSGSSNTKQKQHKAPQRGEKKKKK